MNMKNCLSKLAIVLATAGLCASASASVITTGFTFAVASGGNTDVGSHFHSSTAGDYGNPAGKAEVGRYSSEGVRGLSEYNLTGLSSATSAFVTFNVFKLGGLFAGTNDFPFSGSISVQAYAGNNQENVSDYQALSLGTVGSFLTGGLLVGDILSFDITSLFDAAILAGDTSFGIRLQADPLNARGALTFDNFRLTTDSLCNTPGGCGGNDVPEPGTLALFGLALAGLASARSKKA
jgi:hypothetical protein